MISARAQPHTSERRSHSGPAANRRSDAARA